MHTEEIDDAFVKNYDSTRLIGFRTSKLCQQTDYFSGIQPIYFSTDERMCKDHLFPLLEGMLEEIPAYGLTCGDASTNQVLNVISQDASHDRYMQGVSGFTFILTCIGFALVWALCFFQFKRWYDDREARKEQKETELKNQAEPSDNEADKRG